MATPTRGEIAAVLVELAKHLTLFRDQHGDAFVQIPVDDHYETWPLEGKRFKNSLGYRYYQAYGMPPPSAAVSDAMAILSAQAAFGSAQLSLHPRLARHAGTIYYDLCNREWQAVRLDPGEWVIESAPQATFRRYQHMRPQVEPVSGGSLSLLDEFVNADSDQLALIKVWLVVALVPDIPRTVLVLYGPQGSAKSALTRLLRSLLDPSSVPMPRFPRDEREMAQALAHHCVPCFDNLANLSRAYSDTLCRAVTGDGFTKRRLYTDEEDCVFEFQRAMVLNGINVSPQQPDLLDRSLLIRLDRIASAQRREEKDLLAKFEAVRPQILGAMFDCLSEAMQVYPLVQLNDLPRMADWARWGYAVAHVLGIEGERFIEMYAENRSQMNLEALESHPVGAAIEALMEDRDEWSGSPSGLLVRLVEIAEREQIDTRDKLWPKSAAWLTRRIREVESNLRDAGIAWVATHGVDRKIRFYRVKQEEPEDAVVSVVAVEYDKDDRDDSDRMIQVVVKE